MLGRLLPDRSKRLVGDEREWLRKLQHALGALRAPTRRISPRSNDRSRSSIVCSCSSSSASSTPARARSSTRSPARGCSKRVPRRRPRGCRSCATADTPGRHIEQESDRRRVARPLPLLRDLDIVDTPGTNAIFREHERLTSEFVPQADLVLFVTSADRPFTESERAFLENIRNWGKKIVVVINKVDVLERPEDREQVQRFVAEHAQALLGTTPEVFPVSARHALRTKLGGRRGRRAPVPGDQFADLERYIGNDARSAASGCGSSCSIRSASGSRLVETDARRRSASGSTLLREDLQTIEDIERQLDVYRTDLSREFEFRLSEVDNILHQFENRGMAFFDDTLRIGRIPDLLNKARIAARVRARRWSPTCRSRSTSRCTTSSTGWSRASCASGRRSPSTSSSAARRTRIASSAATRARFQYDRARLINTVGKAAHNAVQTYDKEREASAMADGVRAAVAGAALAQAGAISLGTLVTLLATTTAADVTGIVAAGTIAVLGMFVIPSKRAQAKAQLRERIAEMRDEADDRSAQRSSSARSIAASAA